MDSSILLNQLILSGAGILAFSKVIGLILFSAGMVRAKNTLDILLKNLLVLAMTLLVSLFIYPLLNATSVDTYRIWPVLTWPSLQTQFLAPLFFIAITMTLSLSVVIAATAERLKFWSFFWFSLVMVSVVLPLVLFWVWGKGFLAHWGFIDNGGAATVHLTGAISALISALWIGARLDRYRQFNLIVPRGANLPLAVLGVLFTGLGCIGFYVSLYVWHHPLNTMVDFNMISRIALNTLLAGSAALLALALVGRLLYTRIDLTFILNGTLAGFFVISAAPQLFTPQWALALGAGNGLLTVLIVLLLDKCKVDDPIGAIATHGTSAIVSLGAVSFLSQRIDWQQSYLQWQGIGILIVWVGLSSALLWLIVRSINHLRVSHDIELRGLDIEVCGMSAYPEFTTIRKN